MQAEHIPDISVWVSVSLIRPNGRKNIIYIKLLQFGGLRQKILWKFPVDDGSLHISTVS